MTVLTVAPVVRTTNGIDLAGVAASASFDTFECTGRELLVAKNGSGSPMTVTIESFVTVDGLAVGDLDMVVAAGATRIIGPFPPQWYSSTLASGGSCTVTTSLETDVTLKVIRY